MELFLSFSFSRRFSSFFVFFYYSLLFLKFERGGGCNPRNPPLDPPMYIRIEYETFKMEITLTWKMSIKFSFPISIKMYMLKGCIVQHFHIFPPIYVYLILSVVTPFVPDDGRGDVNWSRLTRYIYQIRMYTSLYTYSIFFLLTNHQNCFL